MAEDTPQPARTEDTGWRKTVVVLGAMGAAVALAVAGRIDGQDALYAVVALGTGYLGINLWSRRQ
jgi:hypothetical protein